MRGSDIVAGVPDDADDGELTRLRAEVALLRDELATAREAEEKFEITAGQDACRPRPRREAPRTSSRGRSPTDSGSTAPTKGRKHSLLARRQPGPSAEEQQQLELIRSSPLFDAAWYLRNNHDVAKAGDEPGLHFLRHPTRPTRAPGPDFDTARYLDAHPEVLEEGINPLVHFLLSEEGKRADRYPPQP